MKRAVFSVFALLTLLTGEAPGAVISSSGYSVSIGNGGNLVPSSDFSLVFQRNSDGFDPILPGSPREAWGVSAGSVAGFVDTFGFGSANLTSNGATFGPNSGSTSAFLNNGSGNLLRIDQNFSFAANNVLQIETTITNVSGSTQAVRFSRNVDWDISPTAFNETINVPALMGPIVAASFNGFESPSPLVMFGAPSGAGGGTFGPNDLGGGFVVDLGNLGAGASTSFNVFQAISQSGQSPSGLQSQLSSLGATFVITGQSSDPAATNSTALAFGPTAVGDPVPEPATLAVFGGLAAAAFGFRRRLKPEVV